jgi:hypothetical protein
MEQGENPFESKIVRSAIGLSGALMIAVVALFFVDGTLRWILLAFAAFDAVFTPYILKKTVGQQQPENDPTAP